MGDNVFIWGNALFRAIVIYVRLSQDFSVRGQDRSPDNTVGKSILPCVIRTVYKILAPNGVKIDQITDEPPKMATKK